MLIIEYTNVTIRQYILIILDIDTLWCNEYVIFYGMSTQDEFIQIDYVFKHHANYMFHVAL